MIIEPFRTIDIPPFLKLAAAENWVSEPWEFEFLLSSFAKGCFAARSEDGESAGFVTSLQHEQSGWIGNLIVAEKFRGGGVGEKLFTSALDALQSERVETFWLTSSRSGQRLYEKHGFKRIDTIIRWRGDGGEKRAGKVLEAGSDVSASLIAGLDSEGWGERRDLLLAATAGRGSVFALQSGFTVLQMCGEAFQIGPFSARNLNAAEQLFNSAIAALPIKAGIYIDAPLSNNRAVALFRGRGMQMTGSSELMYARIKPEYKPRFIYALATMGSCG